MAFVTDRMRSISYDTFARLIVSRHNYLKSQNVKNGDVVAVYIDGSIQSLINICAVLLNKSTYIPIDETLPLSRKQLILSLSNPQITLDSSFELDFLNIQNDSTDFKNILDKLLDYSNDLAYIIFTSGSTGKPKGVKITRCNLLNYISYMNTMLPVDSDDSTIITTSISFDLAYTGLYVALYKQAGIRLLSHNEMSDIDLVSKIMGSNKFSFIKTTPTILSMLIKQGNIKSIIHNLKCLILGGEQIKSKDVKKIIQINPHIMVVNHYGPCETTIGCCAKIINSGNILDYEQEIPIGSPIANAQLYVVNNNLEPVKLEESGRLLIIGPGVGAGYINPPTCNGYIVWNNKQAFLTEDVVKYNKQGEVVILGRTNDFVKIRGYRVSTHEIERHILDHCNVEECQVKLETRGESNQLACYYISKERIGYPVFRHTLEQVIPLYMVPQRIYKIDNFSKSSNGKIKLDLESEYQKVYPSNRKILRRLYEIWNEIGGDCSIKPKDSFFDYNIDSLMNLEFIIKLEKEFPHIIIERENILREYSSLYRLEQAIIKFSLNISRPVDNHIETHVSYNHISVNRWYSFLSSLATCNTICPLPLTQQYYIRSGIMKDVVLNEIVHSQLPISLVTEKIKDWMKTDSILRGCFDDGSKLLIKKFAVDLALPIPTYPVSCFTEIVVEKLYKDFCRCENLIFYPCCFGDSNETYVLLFMKHLFCKTNNLAYFKSFLNGSFKFNINPIGEFENKIAFTTGSNRYAIQYSDSLELIQVLFKREREVAYVSPYLEMPISKLKNIDNSIIRVIIWLVLNVFYELYHIDNIPIRVWKNNKSLNMPTSMLDQTSFDFYLFNYTDLIGMSYWDYATHFDKLSNFTALYNMLNTSFVKIFKDDININIVERKANNSMSPQVESIKKHIKNLKLNSINGICIYGEIDVDSDLLKICYSSNYRLKNDTYFIDLLEKSYYKLLCNGK